ncbi:MAG: hypothetical protein SH850_07865 [Planctomycetaceae bacterium]|nr:hypothetical protein [Planctomycetaceae bacterium]
MSLSYDVEDYESDSALDLLDEQGHEFEDADVSFEEIDFEALGINPGGPTGAKPGSEEKVLMLAARYAAGVPLWHESDCYEHGPSEAMARMMQAQVPQKS